jgi:hypothetical protein
VLQLLQLLVVVFSSWLVVLLVVGDVWVSDPYW